MIHKNGFNLDVELLKFISDANSLRIYVPYIKLNTLRHLLLNVKNCHSICVRWEPIDLITGASDLEVFELCKQYNIPLFRNRRLHLKAFLRNYEDVFVTSANISSRGLNIPKNNIYNYEIGCEVFNLNLSDRSYFSAIDVDSVLITDKIYEAIKVQITNEPNRFDTDNFDFEISGLDDSDFLISALPLSLSPAVLFSIYKYGVAEDAVGLNCAAHDIGLYQIPIGLEEIPFYECLSVNFFNHPLIKLLVSEIAKKSEMFFGEVKDFIYKNCRDTPLPRKWEITQNIQILYSWITYLSEGKIVMDIPYSYSQRLKIIKQND